MKKIMTSVILGGVAAVAFASGAVLVVNGTPITSQEIDLVKNAMAAASGGQALDHVTMARAATDQVIGRVLLADAAKAAGITVDKADVDSAIAMQERMAGGAEKFNETMTKTGIDRPTLEKMEMQRLLADRFIAKEIAPKVKITDEAVASFFKDNPDQFKHPAQVELRMILFKAPPEASKEQIASAQAKAEQAMARLKAGEDFAKVATEMSEDPSAKRGGEVGWVRKGMLLPALEPAVFELKDGERSEVLRSRFGFHIFLMEKHRGEGMYDLAEIHDQLAEMLRQRQIAEQIGAFVRSAREKAEVKALDPTYEAIISPKGPHAGAH